MFFKDVLTAMYKRMKLHHFLDTQDKLEMDERSTQDRNLSKS